MLFNSLQFLLFFVVVFALYWVLPHKWQNRLLLASSYYFYGQWSWKFVSLLFVSTVIDYVCGMQMQLSVSHARKRVFLWISLVAQLGILGFFKYFNFFSHEAAHLLNLMGFEASWPVLHIILPVGISFYTFQTLSYTIDVYKGKLKPTYNFLDFAVFVAFFPHMVAGPIMRAATLLPQVMNTRKFSYAEARQGMRLVLWGLFMKVVVADNLSPFVDKIFSDPQSQASGSLLLATYLFAFQIYCDFHGYSTMARGLAKMLGFDLMVNFNAPYFATSIPEFWKRWHISLTSWFRDFLFIPLGGSRNGRWKRYRNVMIVFLLSGLWHGAQWTFVVWGLMHGLYQWVTMLLTNDGERKPQGFLNGLLTFHLVCLAWIVFRAKTFAQAGIIFGKLFTDADGYAALWHHPGVGLPIIAVTILFIAEAIYYLTPQLFHRLDKSVWFRWSAYQVAGILILVCGNFSGQPFIYFQF